MKTPTAHRDTLMAMDNSTLMITVPTGSSGQLHSQSGQAGQEVATLLPNTHPLASSNSTPATGLIKLSITV
eukprot:1149486-Amphidinium_carterae.1